MTIPFRCDFWHLINRQGGMLRHVFGHLLLDKERRNAVVIQAEKVYCVKSTSTFLLCSGTKMKIQ